MCPQKCPQSSFAAWRIVACPGTSFSVGAGHDGEDKPVTPDPRSGWKEFFVLSVPPRGACGG
ncbi:hypothetical protein CBM2629_A60147 [Cupriavidus taiwanensis]|nr:hypothetical protein CBM2629_A60147 [Cupriavidus taiwanensis]